MLAFDQAFENTVRLEGGDSNHAADRGGTMKFGITETVARENGYTAQCKTYHWKPPKQSTSSVIGILFSWRM